MAKKKKNEANTWAMLCHLTALSIYIGIPFGNLIVPLIIWLIKREEFAFVDEQGKESLNFQISMTIYGIAAGLLCLALIGFVLVPVIVVAHIVLTIMATVKTNQGEGYSYPFSIKFIK